MFLKSTHRLFIFMLEVLLVILVFSLNFVLLHGEGSPVSAGLNSMILLSDYIDRIRSSCRPETDMIACVSSAGQLSLVNLFDFEAIYE